MAEVKLNCAVYGEGTVFSVKLASDAAVEELQEAIFDKKRYKERYIFAASDLTLYLAKKNGAWLKSDPTLKPLLKQGRQEDSDYAEMISNWILDEDYLGANFKPGPKEIHILVELPETAARVASSSQDIKVLIKEAMDEREEEMSAHSLSDLNSELGLRIMKKMRLREDCPDFDEPVDTSIVGYQWIPNVAESEVSQRAGCLAYLRLHLKTLLDRGDFQLVDIAHDKSLLSIVDPSSE